jgi:general secretion pathway protein G
MKTCIRTRPAPRRGGFSLVELMIVLAIMGILAALVLPVAQTTIQRNRERELSRVLFEIRHALDEYKRAADEGRIARRAGSSGYPASLEALVAGAVDLRDPRHAKVFFLRRVPRDPMQLDGSLAGDAGWGQRSYDSEADQPREGADVYDVYSLSKETGLNGVPYGKW